MGAARVGLRGVVAEACGGERALGPAVVDVAEVPVYCVGGGVLVELVANVDQVLDRCEIDVVDGGEVKDDGLECWAVIVLCCVFATAWARVVPRSVAESCKGCWICAARLPENSFGQVVKVVVRVGVIEAFAEPVEEDTWVGILKLNLRVRSIVVIDGQENTANRVFSFSGCRLALGLVIFGRVEKMISDNRMDLCTSEEATPSLEGAEGPQCERDADSGVDTVLDAREDSHKNTSKEDWDFDRRDPPELVDGVWWQNQVTHSVNDDSSQGGVWNIPEHSWESIDGEEYHDGCDDTSKGGTYTSLRLDSSTRE